MGPLAIALLGEPAVAYALLVIGLASGVFAAHNRPELLLGTTGAAAALLALLAYLKAPASAPAVAVLLLGVALVNLEFVLPTFGALGALGIASVFGGSLRLLSAEGFELRGGLALRIALATIGTIALCFATWRALRLRTLPARDC
jgi:membrane-bound serine protease (ClpP class)